MKFVRAVLLLQEKWVLFIVATLMEGPLGFNELGRRSRGVNTTTLAQRLELLEQHGILTKEVQSTMPPKTSYELTRAGKELQLVLNAIGEWSESFITDESDGPCPSEIAEEP